MKKRLNQPLQGVSMDKFKRLFTTILTSGIATVLSFLISFLLTPYITNKLGVEAYGFVTLSKNFTQYAAIITIALNSYASRYITVSYYQNDKKKAQEYFSSIYYGNVVISILIMIVSIIFIIFLDDILNISSDLVFPVKILFFFVFSSFVLTTIGSSYTASAYLKNRLDVVGIFRSLSYIFEVAFYLIVFNCLTPEVWQVGLAICIAQLVIFFGNYYIYKKYTPELKIKRRYATIDAIKKLVFNGVWNSINSLGNTLNSGLDLIVTNLWLSNVAMGQIAITKTISTIFMSFNQLLAQPFYPLFLKSYSEGNIKKLISELKLSMKLTGLLSCIIFAGFVSLGKVFYNLWIPGQDVDLIYMLTIITMISLVIEGPVYPLYYIYTLTVKNKIPCIITVIGGVFNIIGMAVLVRYTSLGVYSIVLTTTIIMLFISLITNPIYMTYCLKIKWFTFYPSLIKTVISCVVMTTVFVFIKNLLNPITWIQFILTAFLCGVVGCIIHLFFVFSNKEKSQIMNIILKRKKSV